MAKLETKIPMSLAIGSLRVGKKYQLTNNREHFHFEVIGFKVNDEITLKDLNTLESYSLQELLQYGKGNDYSLTELE